MKTIRLALLLAAAGLPTAPTPGRSQWSSQPSGTTARLRGLSVAGVEIAWAGGTGGTFARTVDGGKTWRSAVVPGAADLDFRDVHAVDDRTAYLLSSGEGAKSRVFKTTDGGHRWSLQLTNTDPAGFLDAVAFRDGRRGLILGDPVGGRFVVNRTEDGGAHWDRIDPDGMPPALPGEGAFAASGTCLVVRGESAAWFATGGARVARVFRSTDGGLRWTAHETPVRAGNASAGIFSIAFRDDAHGVAIGGDYKRPEVAEGSVATTNDGGRTWTPARGTPPSGYRSAVAFLPGSTSVVAVGPTGSDFSDDGGESWHPLGAAGFHTLGLAGPPATGWAVGDDGRIARFVGDPGRVP